jgi:hypothetical protein
MHESRGGKDDEDEYTKYDYQKDPETGKLGPSVCIVISILRLIMTDELRFDNEEEKLRD